MTMTPRAVSAAKENTMRSFNRVVTPRHWSNPFPFLLNLMYGVEQAIPSDLPLTLWF